MGKVAGFNSPKNDNDYLTDPKSKEIGPLQSGNKSKHIQTMRYLTLLPSFLLILLFACEPEDATIPDLGTVLQPVAFTEVPPEYHHSTTITPHQLEVTLPLLGVTQQMTVEEVNDQLFIEGDILLGDVSEFPNRAATIVAPGEQWPRGTQ
ncbi:MAG: hypothetical protein ACI81P_001654 [Neolewinella sp.]|jgi:hypothetical protein